MVVGKSVQKRSGLFLGCTTVLPGVLKHRAALSWKEAYVFRGLGADKAG